MKLTFYADDLLALETDLLAVASFEGALGESKGYHQLDRALDGELSRVVDEEGFGAKDDESLLVHTHGKVTARRVLLVGLGKREEFQVADTRRYGLRVVHAAQERKCAVAAAVLPALDAMTHERAAQFFAEGAGLGAYRFDRFMSEENRKPTTLTQIHVITPARDNGERPAPPPVTLARGGVIAKAICTARELVNLPAADLTPRELADFARQLAKDADLECKILSPKECEKLGMRLFLAVAQGSVEEPRFIHLTYRPKGKEKPTRRFVLVGKGVTFDSGGLSLKPSAGMLDMKIDMAGSATVLAVMQALPSLGIKSEVHCLVAATENMISGSAYKLGDVITGMGGKSVEIHNTDAEGRLTLADALAYGLTLEPDEMIDVATLTGACMIALGPHIAGLMGSDLAMVERFAGAARRVGEDFWPLPLPKRLREMLKSNIADMKNVGERWGGALTAGLFLKEFIGSTAWIHLDIAGPSSADKPWGVHGKGGTGFGVASIIEYLQSRDGVD